MVALEIHLQGYAEVHLILEIGYDTHLHIIREKAVLYAATYSSTFGNYQ
jgi:hypothetical protein